MGPARFWRGMRVFVKEVMKKDIRTTSSKSTVSEAAKIMASHNIGCLIVVDDTLEGIVTERDVLNKVVARDKDPKQTRISEIMTRQVVTISPDKDMQEACDLMAKHRIKRLPVTFGNEVVGIITSTDVVAILSSAIREVYSQS